MKKKIILAIIVFSTLIACGKKGDPVSVCYTHLTLPTTPYV